MHLTVETEREDDGRWIAGITDLPGVLAYGESREQAIARAEALAPRVLADPTTATRLGRGCSPASQSGPV